LERGGGREVREKVEGQQYTSIVFRQKIRSDGNKKEEMYVMYIKSAVIFLRPWGNSSQAGSKIPTHE
jgi:hypothetical protein